MDRFEKLREHIDVTGGRGLEVGPLTSPVVSRDLGEVYYVDHLSTDDLKSKYGSDPAVDERRIVTVDFVWGSHTLVEAVGSSAPFDYVVASHVLEHVPDLVGWLEEITSVLRPGGRLSVALPDRRYTFDVRRRDSDVSEVIEAYLLGLRRPPVRATFDHFYRYVQVDAGAIWRGLQGHDDPPPDAEKAFAFAHSAAKTDVYLDTHCWVFSDGTFIQLMATLMRMGVVNLRFVAFWPTQVGDFEFFVTLERLADDLSPQQRRELCQASVPALPSAESNRPVNGVASSAARVTGVVLSERELAIIEAKRRVMARVRSAAKLRHRLGRRQGT